MSSWMHTHGIAHGTVFYQVYVFCVYCDYSRRDTGVQIAATVAALLTHSAR